MSSSAIPSSAQFAFLEEPSQESIESTKKKFQEFKRVYDQDYYYGEESIMESIKILEEFIFDEQSLFNDAQLQEIRKKCKLAINCLCTTPDRVKDLYDLTQKRALVCLLSSSKDEWHPLINKSQEFLNQKIGNNILLKEDGQIDLKSSNFNLKTEVVLGDISEEITQLKSPVADIYNEFQTLFEREAELNRELKGVSTEEERKKLSIELTDCEKKIQEKISDYPSLKYFLKNKDEVYRFRDSEHIKNSLKKQEVAAIEQMKIAKPGKMSYNMLLDEKINKRLDEKIGRFFRAINSCYSAEKDKNKWLQEIKKEFAEIYDVKMEDLITFIDSEPNFLQIDGWKVGISNQKGHRDYNEDTFLATCFDLTVGGNKIPVKLFGVFDGHGGDTASKFLAENFEGKLHQGLKKFNPDKLTDVGVWRALKWTCVEFNKEFLRDENNGTSGSTATISLVLDGKLWTANVGDSRIILNSGNDCQQLTEDAKPLDKKYKRGMKKRGGRIYIRGIGGKGGSYLNCGRSIGDQKYIGVSAAPKITCKELSEIQIGDYLILGSDGIYESLTSEKVAEIANTFRKLRSPDVDVLAFIITTMAILRDSGDNLTAIVVEMG